MSTSRTVQAQGLSLAHDQRQVVDDPTLSITPGQVTSITVAHLVARRRFPHQSWWRRWSDQEESAVATALTATDRLSLADREVDDLVRTVFGLESHVLPDPVTGTPQVVPIGRSRTSTGVPDGVPA